MTNKHFKAYTLPFSDPDQIDEATEVYGDIDFPEIEDPCEKSPSEQHEFNALFDPERCIHCRKLV